MFGHASACTRARAEYQCFTLNKTSSHRRRGGVCADGGTQTHDDEPNVHARVATVHARWTGIG